MDNYIQMYNKDDYRDSSTMLSVTKNFELDKDIPLKLR
jgi:hypothetical protein